MKSAVCLRVRKLGSLWSHSHEYHSIVCISFNRYRCNAICIINTENGLIFTTCLCVYWVMFLAGAFRVFVLHAWICDGLAVLFFWVQIHEWLTGRGVGTVIIYVYALCIFAWMYAILCVWILFSGCFVYRCMYPFLLKEMTSISWMCVCISQCKTSCVSVSTNPKHTW